VEEFIKMGESFKVCVICGWNTEGYSVLESFFSCLSKYGYVKEFYLLFLYVMIVFILTMVFCYLCYKF